VKAGRGRAEGEGELPGGAGYEAVEHLGERHRGAVGVRSRRGDEEIVGDGAGAGREADRTEAARGGRSSTTSRRPMATIRVPPWDWTQRRAANMSSVATSRPRWGFTTVRRRTS